MMRRGGFTLLELIVVMAILALLIGLLFPVMETVREKGREALCQSNMRQVGAALEAYRQQNDRLLPRVQPLPSGDPYLGPDGLNGALKHILDPESAVWLCPCDHTHRIGDVPTSYFYVAGAFMFFYPPEPYPADREITLFFDSGEGSAIPILWDSEDRHTIGTDLPRNGLFIDNSVRRVGEPFTIGRP